MPGIPRTIFTKSRLAGGKVTGRRPGGGGGVGGKGGSGSGGHGGGGRGSRGTKKVPTYEIT